jgi:hypothetical protein
MITLSVLLLTGCQEHWYAHDSAELDLEVPAEGLDIDVRVELEPESWPEEVYGEAVRVSFLGDDVALSLLEEGYEELEPEPQSLNILDPFRDCSDSAPCARSFRFAVRCLAADGCAGVFSADAFISTQALLEEGSGPLTLTLSPVGVP